MHSNTCIRCEFKEFASPGYNQAYSRKNMRYQMYFGRYEEIILRIFG